MVKIYEIKARSVIHKTKIPGADWGVNYYRGCTHGCIYCYLKFLCRWRKQKEKWGEFVDVKINAPGLVAKESEDKEGTAILCTGGDAYQHLTNSQKAKPMSIFVIKIHRTELIFISFDI